METALLRILNMSLSAAAVIAAVLFVRLLLRRAPRKWSYLLWSAAGFRLCCPVSFKAAFSLFRLKTFVPAGTQASAAVYLPQDVGAMAQPLPDIGAAAIRETVSSVLPAAEPAASADPLQIWLAVGAALWCAGMAAMLIYAAVRYIRIRRQLADAVLLRENVFESDRIRTPLLLGLLRPRILVPAGLDEETLRCALAHERFHLRHGDHVVKLFAFLLLTLHWFNPLCWLAFALMSRDMELRCDERVLSGEGSRAYSRALLTFSTLRRFPAPGPLAFGEAGVKARIRSALRWKKPKRWVTILAAVLCIAAVAACAANPPDRAEGETPALAASRDEGQPLSTPQKLPAAAQAALDAYLQGRKDEGDAQGDYAQKYERFELMRVLYRDETRAFVLLRDESKGNLPTDELPRMLLTLEQRDGSWSVSDATDRYGKDGGWTGVEDSAASLFAQYRTLPLREEVDAALELLRSNEVLASCFPSAGSTPELWKDFFAAYPGQIELFFDERQSAALVSRTFFRTFGVENMDFASPTFVISLRKSCEIDLERFLPNIGFFFDEDGDGDTIWIAVQVGADGRYYMKADPWAVEAQKGWMTFYVPRGPGELLIAARQGSVKAWHGTTSWYRDLGNGKFQSFEADSDHPLSAAVQLPTLSLGPDTISMSKPNYVSLLFDLEPSAVEVVCWDDSSSPGYETPGESLTPEAHDGVFGFELREGSWIYMLTARWNTAEYRGEAIYAFLGRYGVPVLGPTGGELYGPDLARGAELYVEEGYTRSFSRGENGAGMFAETPHAVWHVTENDLREAILQVCGKLRQYRQIERAGDVMNGTPERVDCLPCAYLVTDSVCYRIEVVKWENFMGGAWADPPIRAERFGEPTLQVSRLDLSRMPEGETPYGFAKAYFGPDSLNGEGGAGWYSTLSPQNLDTLLYMLGRVGVLNAEKAEEYG